MILRPTEQFLLTVLNSRVYFGHDGVTVRVVDCRTDVAELAVVYCEYHWRVASSWRQELVAVSIMFVYDTRFWTVYLTPGLLFLLRHSVYQSAYASRYSEHLMTGGNSLSVPMQLCRGGEWSEAGEFSSVKSGRLHRVHRVHTI